MQLLAVQKEKAVLVEITGKNKSAVFQGVLFAILFAAPLASVTQAQEQTGPKAEQIKKDILKLEGERSQALEKGDIAALDRILAPDYVYVNVFGELNAKAERLSTTQSGVSKHETLTEDDFRVHVYGDTVILTGRASGVVDYKGKVNDKVRRFTNVYMKLNGQWRLVSHQATTIAEP